jgi:hypothetical protein
MRPIDPFHRNVRLDAQDFPRRHLTNQAIPRGLHAEDWNPDPPQSISRVASQDGSKTRAKNIGRHRTHCMAHFRDQPIGRIRSD